MPQQTPAEPAATERATDDLAERCERYRRALVYIADRESGVWGVVAREALRPKAPTTGDAA